MHVVPCHKMLKIGLKTSLGRAVFLIVISDLDVGKSRDLQIKMPAR